MFSPDDREQLRAALISDAQRDERISGAALTGSAAVGGEDRWSDIDLALCVASDDDLDPVRADWTARTYDRGAVDHVDVLRGTSFPGLPPRQHLASRHCVLPAAEFGAIAPTFRLIFGTANDPQLTPPPRATELIGMGWLYALHARSNIERGRVWQAECMISALRERVLALACLRHGLPTNSGRGMDGLRQAVTAGVQAALVRSLDADELRRAFRAASAALLIEIHEVDADLLNRLAGPLKELAHI